ncbi:MAG TPA: HlyD family efflux transporter periplasmic adaptor subunit [Gemmataceae bacterium]|nr:HlyD family efflux transporter periplasmic adaptor subunit [Gemmataceae bacterium]
MRLRLLAPYALFVAAGLTAGCGTSTPPAVQNANAAAAASGKEDANPDVGTPLFPAAKTPTLHAAGPRREALTIHSTAQFEERQQVAAEVDGKIELLATPLEPGAAFDKNDPNIVFHPRDFKHERPHRRLSDGDVVKKDQVLCFLDDQLVSARMDAATSVKAAVEQLQTEASKGVRYTEERLKLQLEGFQKGVVSRSELLQDYVTLTRFMENLAQAAQTLAKTNSEFKENEVMLRKHRIHSGVNGVIRSISKRVGEFVKAGEKILEIQGTDKIRLEGNLHVQYSSFVPRGLAVSVEPALTNPAEKSLAAHRQEVTGIAVTANPGRPMIVSVGADGSAIVWDFSRDAAGHNLSHPVGVRGVACSPAASKAVLVVTGSDDGKVRVWDVSNPDKLPGVPKHEPTDGHSSAVQAIAFSPDGKYFATAAGRDVFVWEAEGAKKLYTLPAEHRDTVTALAFTPQATLVTASKDRTLKVWKLGAEKAAVTKTIDHRAGTVDVLGVSADGGRVLFDQDKGRIDLVSLADKQTVGQITNPADSAAFATLAAFGGEDSLVVTAGSEGDLKGTLQVWRTPDAGGRGSEVARFVTPKRIGATCAAFGPGKDKPFVAVGTAAGTVHLWVPPTGDRKAYTGKVTYVDSTDPLYVTVRVEVDNRELNLPDRSTATVIVNLGK